MRDGEEDCEKLSIHMNRIKKELKELLDIYLEQIRIEKYKLKYVINIKDVNVERKIKLIKEQIKEYKERFEKYKRLIKYEYKKQRKIDKFVNEIEEFFEHNKKRRSINDNRKKI